jgi:hypothetical protein
MTEEELKEFLKKNLKVKTNVKYTRNAGSLEVEVELYWGDESMPFHYSSDEDYF